MRWIILLTFFVSFHSWACMPIPVPKCQKLTIKKDVHELASLMGRVNDYYKYRSLSIKGQPTHSCFNQNLAGMYGDELLKRLKENKGMTCKLQLERGYKPFMSLISTESDEFKATDKDSRIALTEKAKVLEVKIRNFFE